jgi:predicted deacylase
MALAFGLDHIVKDNERPLDAAASVYLSNTAITRGKPALTTETGGMARVDEESIALLQRGVSGLMRHLGMQKDGPLPVTAPIWIERSEVLRAGATGIFYAEVERGHTVARGARIGRITDFHGRTIEDVMAPFDGEILYVVGTPPVSKGEPVAMIGSYSPVR